MGWSVNRIEGFWKNSSEYIETGISYRSGEDTMFLTVNSVDGKSTITLDCIAVEKLIKDLQRFMVEGY